MAQFIPALRLTTPRSNAERRILQWLDQLPSDWVVLHSLGVLNHPFKQWAEIDVLVIGPRGLMALEVKGGRILERHGRWGYQDAAGEITWKNESPFDQAGSAHGALRSSLIEWGALPRQAVSGYAVLTPDVEFGHRGPGVDDDVLLDASRSWGDPARIIARWCSYWGRRKGLTDGLAQPQVLQIVEILRPELDLKPALSLLADGVNRELTRLTDSQRRVLAAARDNPRLAVRGRAGTGKTMLALTEAKQLADDGLSVLYLCRSEELARRSAEALAGLESMKVATPERLTKGGAGSGFDAVVVDEAQDFAASLPDLLERYSAGGLVAGTWRIFLDPAQALLEQVSDDTWAAMIDVSFSLRLTMNCRNTRQIAVTTSMLTQIEMDLEAPAEGPDVHQRWWDDSELHDAALAEQIARLAAALEPASLAVISHRPMSDARVKRLAAAAGVALRPLQRPSRGAVTVATAQEFKGLESDAVIVADVQDLGASENSQHFYVACTRARVHLSLLLHESLRDHYQQGALWLGRRAAGRG